MELLTIAETAKLLKLSVNHVYVLTKQGVIPSVKVSGSIRVIREELENWIKGGGKYDTE